MTISFNHLHFIVEDLEASVLFFTEILGATLEKRKMYGNAKGAVLKLGGMDLCFRTRKEGEELSGDSAVPRYGYDHIGLKVEDVDSFYEELMKKGVEFIVTPVEFEDLRIAFLKGPDNITIEILSDK